jgi:hypothetical protein
MAKNDPTSDNYLMVEERKGGPVDPIEPLKEVV